MIIELGRMLARMGVMYGWTPDRCLSMTLPCLLLFHKYGLEFEGLKAGIPPASEEPQRKILPANEDKPDKAALYSMFKVNRRTP